MNQNLQREIQSRIESFATDLTAIIQRAVADAMGQALASLPPRAGAKGQPATKAAEKASRGAVSEDDVLRAVKKQPNLRMEELSRALGAPSKAIKGPVKALVAKKKLKTSGKARGTKYRAA
jgi:hypothetical protein